MSNELQQDWSNIGVEFDRETFRGLLVAFTGSPTNSQILTHLNFDAISPDQHAYMVASLCVFLQKSLQDSLRNRISDEIVHKYMTDRFPKILAIAARRVGVDSHREIALPQDKWDDSGFLDELDE